MKNIWIAHHGIEGQKWGQRNGPPYPLDYKSHSAEEKRKNSKRSLSLYDTSDKKGYENITSGDLRKYRQRLEAEHDKTLPRELTSEEKARRKKLASKIILGSLATAGIGFGLYLAYKHGAVEDISEYMSNNEQFDKEEIAQIMKSNLGDQVLPKGTDIQRIVHQSGIDFSKVKDATYVSYTEKDNLTYLTKLRDWSGTGETYKVTLQAAKDLRIPSKEKAVEVFEKLYNEDPQYKNQLRTTLEDTYKFLSQYPEDPELPKRAKSWAEDQMKNPFEAGIYSIVRRQKDSKRLIDEYKKLGYDAITDYFDQGGFTDSPLIVFDPSQALTKIGEEKVTTMMKEAAFLKLYDMRLSK